MPLCVLPEYAEECVGQGERGAHGPGYWPTGYGKLLRLSGAEQARPAQSQALQLLLFALPGSSHSFLCWLGTC